MIDKIEVLEPIRLGQLVPVPGGTAQYLLNVRYLLEAHYEPVGESDSGTPIGAHQSIFKRRLRRRQFRLLPFLGWDDCPATLQLIEDGDSLAPSRLPAAQANLRLGRLPVDSPDVGHSGPNVVYREAWLSNGAVTFNDDILSPVAQE